ncbi:hypothetical protein AGOR_G00068080 [Albula goreensis]|uniref:Uncharacterized protein n=1 Tax=Albula goreensis TaxID=1534307 RepID=A0A8T3DTC1_9TELE|nr:hypothetical protein AGOR_G00068080 [Albula goreensis]
MSSPKNSNRHVLMCSVCQKPVFSLPVHLRRTCMKNGTEAEIHAAVEAAKKDVAVLLQKGRIWEYITLKRIMDSPDPLRRMVEELMSRGQVVRDLPTAAPPPAAATSRAEVEGEVMSFHESESSVEQFQSSAAAPEQRSTARQRMTKAGLYKKHSLNHPLLKGFATYLRKDLANENYKQEVDNVARYLHFMDPTEPNLKFVHSLERTREYYHKLAEAKLCKQTVQNYIKSLKRLVVLEVPDCLHQAHAQKQDLHQDCKNFIDFLSSLQILNSKETSKEVFRRRYAILREGLLSPRDCGLVLRMARNDFLAVIRKLVGPQDVEGTEPTKSECQLVVYYLEATLMLRHMQRPGVIEHMTVQDWVGRSSVPGYGGHVVIGVMEHTSVATQVATFALSQEVEAWFQAYFEEVRPTLLGKKRQLEEDDTSDDRFFISGTGKPIYNASNDLERLHSKYNCPKVTSQMARRAFEMATKKDMADADKSLVSNYLTHSTTTAKKHRRMLEAGNVVRVSLLLQRLAGDTDSGSEIPGLARGEASVAHRYNKMDEQTAYDSFSKSYPVTLNGCAPKRSIREQLAGKHERRCYDRWRQEQLELRIQHVLSHFNRCLPSESRVKAWVQKQGWKINIPDSEKVVSRWKPADHIKAPTRIGKKREMKKKKKIPPIHLAQEEGDDGWCSQLTLMPCFRCSSP